MSDVGLPPGALVYYIALGLVAVFGTFFVISILVAWLRTRRRPRRMREHRAFGYFLGSAATALASAVSMWLIEWSGSLGNFARWVDHETTSWLWLAMLIALCPVVAFTWNRSTHRSPGRAE